MINLRLLLLLAIITNVFCLYEKDSAVVALTNRNFKPDVLESDEFWLVEFYAPWCGHCKHAAPEYEKAAEILKGIVNVGAVDMTTDGEVGSPYGVSGYPTIKFFGGDKKHPIDFSSSDRTFQKFVSFSLAKVKAEISSRLKQIGERGDNKASDADTDL